MKKKTLVMLVIAILILSISACGASGSKDDNGSSNSETSDEKTGPFSGTGGWKAEEGIILLLDADGSGAVLSEASHEGDTSDLNLPSVFKTDITWEEDDKTVNITAGDKKYSLQKKKDGENESLELSEVSYARLSEEELKEYKEKADSVASADPNAAGAEDSNDSSSDNSIIEFSDTILLDNDLVTVELAQFFEKEVNWAGASEPQMEKYVTLKVHNNSDKEIMFNLNDAYINDESVKVIMQDGNSGPAPGKTKTYTYDIQYNTSPNPKALDSIEDLYTLDANIETFVYDGGSLTDRNNTRFCINDVLNGVSEAAAAGEESASSEDIEAALQGTWMLDDNTFTFDNGNIAIIGGGVSFSGTYEVNTADSVIDAYIEASDGTLALHMPYTYSNGELTLKNNQGAELTKQ